MRTLITTLATAWLFSFPATAQMQRTIPDEFLPDATTAIRNAVTMLTNNEGAEAYTILVANAELGDLNARFLVGFCLENGYGTAPDIKKAAEFYKLAADEGHAAAQYGLGVLNLRSATSKEEARLAVTLIDRAAQADIIPARRQLARIHLEGVVVPARPELAIAQLKKGAEMGDAESHYLLAQLYQEGVGSDEPDFEKAFEHYVAAAKGGNTPSLIYLGLGHQEGKLLKLDLVEAVRYFEKADELGNPVATFHLAKAYSDGKGVSEDKAKAYQLFKKASDLGHLGALLALAEATNDGVGCEKDQEAAFALFEKAANAGSGEAMIRLSVNYRNGEGGVEKDEKKADLWMLTAGKMGFPPAANALGVMYRKGDHFPQDEIAAAAWFMRAADGGFAAAMINLGDMFERGIALPTSFGTAGQWYQRAAEAGHPVGVYQMARLIEQGTGTEPDPYKAYILYSVAAAKGHEASARARIRVGKELRPSQLGDAKKEIEAALETSK